MMRTTIFRSNRMAIAVVGAVAAPTFAFGQQLTVTAVTAPSSPIQAQTPTAPPTIRPGEFYAAPYVERVGGPANAGFIAGTGEVPGVPLTITERPLQSHERVFVVVPPGMSSAAGTRYLAVRPGRLLEGVGQIMIPTGVVAVERAEPGQAIEARVMARYEPMMIGDQLVTMDAIPANLPRPTAVTGPTTSVLWIKPEPVLPTLQSYVIVGGVLILTLLLLTQALTQRLEQFVPASEGLDAALLSFRERALGECSHPVRGDLGEQLREAPFGAGKHLGKDAIEAIVVAFVLNETGAREVVEILRRQLRHARPQCLQEHQELGGGHRHARAAQLKEELHQHGGPALSAPGDA